MALRTEFKEHKLSPPKPYPFLPEQVPLSALVENRRLCSAKNFEKVVSDVKESLRESELKEGEGSYGFTRPGIPEVFVIKKAGVLQYYFIHEDKNADKGGYGTVRMAQNQQTGKWFALKSQSYELKAKNAIVTRFAYENERNVLRELNLLEGELFEEDDTTFQNDLLMELAQGRDLVKLDLRRVAFVKKLRMIVKLFEAVKELHKEDKETGKKAFWHCDLKKANIVYFLRTGKLKLVDFAFALRIKKGKEHYFNARTDDHVGPENKTEPRVRDEATEVYAVGVALAKIFGFWDREYKKIIEQNEDDFLNNQEIPDLTTRVRIHGFLKRMTASAKSDRPAVQQCLDRFKRELDALLPVTNTNVGIVDIREILENKNDFSVITPLIQAMKQVDKVWMVNTAKQDYTDEEYIQAERLLARYGVQVGNKIFHEPGRSIVDVACQIPTYKPREGYYRTYHLLSLAQRNDEDLVKLKEANVGFVHATSAKSEAVYQREILNQEIIPAGLITNLCRKLDKDTGLDKYDVKEVADVKEDKDTTDRVKKRKAAIAAGLEFFKIPRTRCAVLSKLDELAEAQKPTGKIGKLFEQIYVHSAGKIAIKNMKKLVTPDHLLSPRLASRYVEN